jgi:peptide chain release factor subunit 3
MKPTASEFKMTAGASAFVPGGFAPPAAAAPAAELAAAEPAQTQKDPEDEKPSVVVVAAPAAEPEQPKAEESAAASASSDAAAPKSGDDGFVPSDAAVEAELKAIAAAEGHTVEEIIAEGEHISDEEDELEVAEGEAEDDREPINVVFIGHVDAGKSTLSGQILYQCGMVDERTIEKYQQTAKENNRESWFLSYIMDTNEEERAKGKTVEVGRAFFNTPTKRYTILDAPGHKNYVPNMIGGAAQADLGVLVISARMGEFETGFHRGGQTQEHAMLCKTLGVRSLVVVVNKMDDPTVKWSTERYSSIENELGPFLRSIGYQKTDITFVPVSGLKGTNVIKNLTDDPENPELKELYKWYKGSSLIHTLDSIRPINRDADGPVRVPILDKVKDRGTVQLLGKLEQGTITVGDSLVLIPNITPVEVTAIHTDQAKIRRAGPGENIRISVKGVEEDGVQRGFMLSSPGNDLVPCVNRFEAQLVILELLAHKTIFSAGYKAVLHIHTAVEECVVSHLLASINRKTGKVAEKKPKFVKAGAVLNCIVRLARPVPVELFENAAQLGRFTLRDEGKTIAIGKITRLPKAKGDES